MDVSLCKKYWHTILFYSVAGVISTLMGRAGSLMTKRMIDIVIGHDADVIGIVVVTMIGMGIGTIVINSITSRISTYFPVKVQNEIQADVYDKIMEADWESLYEYRIGDLLNRLNGDISNVSKCVISWIPNFFYKNSTVFWSAKHYTIL